ncbi:MAG: PKD domain-containing protein [Acidobacteriota bacterium]|nr:PKD domain-containing protein [Acidobacteriota bacterium]
MLPVLAPIVLLVLLVTLPASAYEMKINGKETLYEEGSAGQSVTFTVFGAGFVDPEAPPCTHSRFSYAQEKDGILHEALGNSLTVSAQPGMITVQWSRYATGSPTCNGGGSVRANFYAFAEPHLDDILLDPPDVKINQAFFISPKHIPCPAKPSDPNSSDPCRGDLTWDPGDGRCAAGTFCSPAFSYYERLGTFTLRGKYTNLAGSSQKSITVNVGATRAPEAAFQILAPTPIAGSPVPFTNQTMFGFRSLFWDFGDGTTSTEENPSHTFPATDEYIVRLTATNEIGSSTYETTVTVLAKSGGTPPIASNFSWTPEKPVIGQLVSFTDKSTGTITRWRWNFADGSEPSYDPNPTHVFHNWGQKNVELWVSNQYGRKGILLFIQVLSNTGPPLADFDFTPFAVRVGQTVTFTDTSAGASSWLWDFGEGNATSVLQNPTHVYQTAGQKAVTLKVTNAFGTDSVTKFFACHAEENDLESRFSWTPPSPEAGEPVQFIDLSTGTPDRWSWVISDGTQSNQRNLTHTFATPGEYGVSLRVDKGAQTHILLQIVRVGETTGPIPDFTWTPGTPKPGQTVKFTNLSSDATSYSWTFGDGSSSNAVDPEHKFATEKTYRVTLTARNSSGQESSITKEITVSTVPIVPIANFSARPNPASVNTTVKFTDTSTGNPAAWDWDFGYSNQKSSEQHPTHAFPFEGTFLVRLTVSNSAGTSTPITLPVVVKNQLLKPEPDFTWTPDPALAAVPVTFTDKSTNSPKGWSWTFGDGGTDSGSSAQHTYATPGNYPVTLRVSNEAGQSELTRTIIVGAPPLQAEFSFAPAQPAAGKAMTFTDQSTGEAVSWKWLVDGQTVATTRNLTWTFFNGGEHVVGLEIKGKAGNESFRQKGIPVLAPPVASFRAQGSFIYASAITFVDTSSGNPTIRRWFVDGNFAGSQPQLVRAFNHLGDGSVRLEVENEAGKDGVTRFFAISANGVDGPRIKSVQPQFGPCFYSGYPMSTPIEVEVDWRKHQVGRVTLELNAVADPPVQAVGTKAALNLESRRLEFDSTVNDLSFSAIGDGGFPSEPYVLKFLGITVPHYLIENVERTISEEKRKSFTQGLYLPPKPYESKSLKLPQIFGGGEFQLTKTQFKFEKILRTDCSISTYAEIAGGLKLGKGFAGIKGKVKGDKTLSALDKTLSDEMTISLEGFGGMSAKLRLDDAIPAMKVPCSNSIVDYYICSVAEVKIEGQASLGGAVTFKVGDDGGLTYKNTDKTFKLQVFVTGTLSRGSAKFEAFGGGKAAFKLGDFSDEHLVKKADFLGELGGRLIWHGTLHEYKTGYGCTFQYNKDPVCGENVSDLRLQTQSERAIPLQAVAPLDRKVPVELVATQAPVVLQNVSSLADPSSSSRGDRSVIVYLSEQEAAGASLQRLDVKALRRDSATGAWGAAQTISVDANGDFNPVAAIDANNRTVVAWERLRNPALSYADLPTLDDMPKLLGDVEIAVSMSDATSATWLAPEMLTSNDLQDRQPVLAALADGRTILVWIREPAASGDQQLVARILSGSTWSAEQVIASGLRGIGEIAIAVMDNDARVIVSHRREAGGNDLSFFTFGASGWSAREVLTNDAEDDRAPMVAFEALGPRAWWVRDGAIVSRALAGGELERVRETTDAATVLNPSLAIRADETPLIAWSTGSDVRAVLRDPKTNRWTSDFMLTDKTRSHVGLSAFFTSGGELHLSTLGTTLELRDVTREIDGQPVLIEGVAFPGRSDLVAFQTPLRVDLSAAGETFAADPRQPIIGERVLVSIDLHNGGELPVRDVVVDVRRGENVAGTTTVAGDWMPGETKRIEIPITFDASSKELVVIVDPAGLTSDAVPANNRASFSFGNRDPLACFQASAGSGPDPLTVTFDAGCSADFEGAIARYSWSFGDGESASGTKISHTFATAGTHLVLLTVTDAMGATSTRTITIDTGLPQDWRAPSAVHRLYLSVVGRAQGVNNTFFVSDLALVNTDVGAPLTIDAVYLPDGRTDAYRKRMELAPGALLQTRDLVAQLFGATNGTGSLRLDLSSAHVVAVARTYNDQPAGTAGFSNEALPAASALLDGEKGIILQHWLPGYRTNIGFTEIDGRSSEITATAFNEAGVLQGQTTFGVGPYGHTQINGHALFQGRGRIEVAVRGGAVLAYASTIDGKTGDPIYQSAERIPAAGPRSLLIPIVGRLTGVNNSLWRSDVRVMNADTAAQTVTLALRTPGGAFSANRTLAPGETLAYDDVITNAFPQLAGSVGGSLLVTSAGPIIATSRTFNVTSVGTYGLYVPSRPAAELTHAGVSAWLVQLQENDDYRCNLGITSYDVPVTVSVRAFDAAGTTLAVKQYGLGAGQNVQIGRVFADMGIALPLDAVGAEVTVLHGTAFLYASVVDNRTGDTTFVEGRR